LIDAIPSDGYNETLQILGLNHRFSFMYRSMVYLGNDFKVELKDSQGIKEYLVQGVHKDKFPSIETLAALNKKQLRFEIENDIGYLTVKTFAKSTIKANEQKFRKFVKQTFKTVKDKSIKDLVIDLRYNTGGTDGNAAFLASYFFNEEFRYWDKIEVTKDIASQIKGTNRIFYKKPEKVDSTYLWKGALLTKEFDYYKTQKPAKNNFKGNVYIITNGFCMSSCADFVAILSSNNIAKVIGQETGGGYQGNTSGMMPKITIKQLMIITIPLQKYTNYVDLEKNFGRGTIPDFNVYPTLDEWIAKKDVEQNFIKEFLKKKRR